MRAQRQWLGDEADRIETPTEPSAMVRGSAGCPAISRRKRGGRRSPVSADPTAGAGVRFWEGGFSEGDVVGRSSALTFNGHLAPSCSSSFFLSTPGTLTGSPLATTLTNIASPRHPPPAPASRRTATKPKPGPEGASPLFLLLTMALGGLGALLLSGHPSLSPHHVLSQVDLRSVFFGLVFAIIVLVLGA